MITLNQVKELNLHCFVFDLNKKLFTCLMRDAASKYEYTSEVIKICRMLKNNNLSFDEDKLGNIKVS